MQIKPLGDRILVLPDPPETTYAQGGAIVRPDIGKERPAQGKVIAVGHIHAEPHPEKKDDDGFPVYEQVVNPGDQVLYGQYSGAEIEDDGQEYLLLRLDEILGIVQEGEMPRHKTRVSELPNLEVAEIESPVLQWDSTPRDPNRIERLRTLAGAATPEDVPQDPQNAQNATESDFHKRFGEGQITPHEAQAIIDRSRE